MRYLRTTLFDTPDVPGASPVPVSAGIDLARVIAWKAVLDGDDVADERGTWVLLDGTMEWRLIGTEPATLALKLALYGERADAPRDLYRKPQ